ncbi:DUF1540 domain-containing protein [Paenibacillus nasutitermitis]|uniref:DUF1540 domain-containing protein n=1 Tax=Paenibacillus nasutitermitis TaxID=1652958 RepID=A0A917DUY3_9BACL|nr:DUF1540 domain-containing protein [Paenibacillus nasutitermitis]GGD71296.1 hypothetical protein GCM10010911_31470 [Paenibacillus nasutitermitis]
MPKGVSCSVANCSFWGQGNQCNADQIMIDIDSHAHMDYKSEFAGDLQENHKDSAVESGSTCCHTFKPKE